VHTEVAGGEGNATASIQNISGLPHRPTDRPGGRLTMRQSRREGPPMSSMGRREFVALLGGAASWPIAARAQPSERMRRIGFIQVLAENDPEAQARITAFQQRLAALDWIEGSNIRIIYRFAAAGDAARIQTNVAELVNSAPDLIVAGGTPVIAALKRVTSTIPIVFAIVNDPVGQGFITSLARPGGNITGLP
jgi:ABC-type uncharacterized transport system substrate-binding protein